MHDESCHIEGNPYTKPSKIGKSLHHELMQYWISYHGYKKNMDSRIAGIEKGISRITNRVIGSIEKNSVRAYWYDSVINFGDLLVPSLLKSYGLTALYTPKPISDVICIGSILQNLNEDYDGYIIGCGLLRDRNKRFPRAKILALRGKLTQARLGASEDTVIGDPGLLIGRLQQKRQPKKYVVGLVPHFRDKNDKRLQMILQRFPKDVVIIDVQQNPQRAIRDIDKCEFILSSSLHGIVTADSLHIPNAWMLLSEKTTGTFKFYDYGSALGMELEPVYLSGKEELSVLIKNTHEVSSWVEDVKNNLDKIYKRFSEEILSKQNTNN